MDIPTISAENVSKLCRICLENDNPNDFIRPCLCTGGSAHVHRKCLDNWRSLNKDGRAFKFCDVCQFEYVIEPVVDNPSADRKRLLTFRLLVTRDITLIILLVQVIIIGMTFLLQAVDKKSQGIRDLYPPSMGSFGVYYLSSLILLLALLGLFGLIGLCCGLISSDDPSDCTCYQCLCCYSMTSHGCNGHHDCDCNGGGHGNCSGEGAVVAVVVIIVAFAIIGVFIGIILSVIIIRKIRKRHTKILWLKQEAKKYIVKDFEGRINELKNIPTRRPNADSLRHDQTDSDTTYGITPSAPVQILSYDNAKYTTNN